MWVHFFRPGPELPLTSPSPQLEIEYYVRTLFLIHPSCLRTLTLAGVVFSLWCIRSDITCLDPIELTMFMELVRHAKGIEVPEALVIGVNSAGAI